MDRLWNHLEEWLTRSDDDALIVCAWALVLISMIGGLVLMGVAFGALMWALRPWSIIVLAGSVSTWAALRFGVHPEDWPK